MTATKTATLILASSSPRRQELIRTLKLPVVIQVSDADETVPGDWEPAKIVEELSLRKARAVYDSLQPGSIPDGIVIGSDTIVVLEGDILGKPKDRDDAAGMLERLQGRTHQVYSGVACLDRAGGHTKGHTKGHTLSKVAFKPLSAAEIKGYTDIGQYRVLSESPSGQPEAIVGHTVSNVTFRPMSSEEIQAYVKTGEPLDKAGSYGVQGLGAVFIEKIEGDFYSVMGLPLNLLYQILLGLKVSLF